MVLWCSLGGVQVCGVVILYILCVVVRGGEGMGE